ncbi:MurR/RpiR family transcriptional regulator [Methylobacterium sp.]|uniref:MurR/RpiR family transcriptional regulator n=1 Tax=Methylobacterium sp. TaxID=409 RepID=UPI003B006F97
MERSDLTARIKDVFDDLPGQIKIAARFVLENPHDVALLSMREQARRAEVPPATMTRFAQYLGLSGYDDIRAIHAASLRNESDAFADRAESLVRRHREVGVSGVAIAMVESLAGQVKDLGSKAGIERLVAAADELNGARRILCIGQRSSFPVAYQFAHVLAFFESRAKLLDAAGGTGSTALLDIGEGDVVLVSSFTLASRSVVEMVAYARRQGARVIAITDSEASPIGRLAHRAVIVGSRSPSFFDTVTPAFAACEILIALVAGLQGDTVPTLVGDTETRLHDLKTWWRADEPLPNISRDLQDED